jgi:adenylate kinase family enzyme
MRLAYCTLRTKADLALVSATSSVLPMRRILVIGASGAGKSTLARAMGAKLDLPVIHLDRHYWSPGWVAPEPAEWRRRVEALVARDVWVMDGNYSGTFDLRLPSAEAIVWLDLPRRLYFPRAMRRLVVNYGRERGDIGPGCPERFDFDFLFRWVWTYPTRSRPKTLKLLDELARSKRIVVLKSPREVDAFCAGLPAALAVDRA